MELLPEAGRFLLPVKHQETPVKDDHTKWFPFHFAAFEKGAKQYSSRPWLKLDETFACACLPRPTPIASQDVAAPQGNVPHPL